MFLERARREWQCNKATCHWRSGVRCLQATQSCRLFVRSYSLGSDMAPPPPGARTTGVCCLDNTPKRRPKLTLSGLLRSASIEDDLDWSRVARSWLTGFASERGHGISTCFGPTRRPTHQGRQEANQITDSFDQSQLFVLAL